MQKYIICLSTLALCACSSKVIYKDVLVPVKCDIEIPKKPRLSGDLLNDVTLALKHSENLEFALRFCVEGE